MYRGLVDPGEFTVSNNALFSNYQPPDAADKLQARADQWKIAMLQALGIESYRSRKESQWLQRRSSMMRLRNLEEPQQCCTCPSQVLVPQPQSPIASHVLELLELSCKVVLKSSKLT